MKVVINSGEPLLEKTLTRWGYDVWTAENSQQAMGLLTQENPATLVILSSESEGLRGADLCRRLRTQSRDQYIYVILLIEKLQGDDLLEAFEQGADDYLTKPYDGYELRAKLLVAKRILSLQERLLSMRDELLVQATHDALTGLWNRRATLEALARELARSKREGRPVGLILADIDHFKKINDTYGHLAGDCMLQTVATRLKNAMRSYDTVGRYGGEEFLIISPGCDETALMRRAEHLRETIAAGPIVTREGNVWVTLSVGAAVATTELPQDQLIKAADEALYRAKRGGRNRSELAETLPTIAC
ncbi:MAG TPA: diguanylate cyclase [Candidatus Acidoferrales bacterium]|jgi:diguanylate cyclase (GGDEF)-like protein|nr:diguanylate cyclase [Candidatus Acidoferrales bacterium]